MSLITWNPVDKGSKVLLYNGNLRAVISSRTDGVVRAVSGKSSGKWYWEIKINTGSTAPAIGIATKNHPLSEGIIGLPPYNIYGASISGIYARGGITEQISTGKDTKDDSIIGVLLDLNDKKLRFIRDGIIHDPSEIDISNISGEVFASLGAHNAIANVDCTSNFGDTPFTLAIQNPSMWKQIQQDGYLPYDINNATWITTYKHLLKSNNKIYTLSNTTDTLENITSSILDVNNITKLEYETYGFNDLSKLTTQLYKQDEPMTYDNEIGTGKMYRLTVDRSITPIVENIDIMIY